MKFLVETLTAKSTTVVRSVLLLLISFENLSLIENIENKYDA